MAENIDAITQMRTIAWLHDTQRAAGAKGASSLANRYAKLTLHRQFDSDARLAAKEFKQYVKGETAPSKDTLQEVDEVLPGTWDTFRLGPRENPNDRYCLLWLALGGPGVVLREVILDLDPAGISARYARSTSYNSLLLDISSFSA